MALHASRLDSRTLLWPKLQILSISMVALLIKDLHSANRLPTHLHDTQYLYSSCTLAVPWPPSGNHFLER